MIKYEPSTRSRTLKNFAVGGGGGGGQKAFLNSALVQILDLGLEAWTKLKINCQTPGLGLRLGIDFVFPLSQQEQQEPPPKSKMEFDTKDQVFRQL